MPIIRSTADLYLKERLLAIMETNSYEEEERRFAEFRRKVRSAEVLSTSIARLLQALHFTGRLCVVVQNGQVLKSGYEEGYFRQVGPESGLSIQ